ncbi:MAG: sigma-54-dependent Fis family transcriptional regulator [Nitrospirae bacterium]|nr:sigma-54-dependent Fis family transcriptional regulator [Nitrospirota bacterium]
MFSILLVEDKESMARMIMTAVRSEGYEVVWASNGKEGMTRFKERRFDLVVSDLKLPFYSGLEILSKVKETHPMVPVILMTAFGSVETAVKAVKEGAFDFITKPFEPDHLLLLIKKALENQKLLTENMILKEEYSENLQFPKIIGKSQKLMEMLEIVKKVSQNKTTVLLGGESGTGKELIARALHLLSPRKEDPFIAINCAAIPRDLLESELFGHERGSFTGATEKKLGKFELADRGTLFLDEIGDMDLGLQGKLLRVLEEHALTRVGGVNRVIIDVRVIAATNKDLKGEIARKTFREDLYFRLNVFPIVIPPLRERKEDILPLAEYFIDYYCKEMKKGPKVLSTEAKNKMSEHPWLGNIRELQNCIERAVILSDHQILPHHLGLSSLEVNGLVELAQEFPPDGGLMEASSKAGKLVESQMIKKVLEQTDGNKTKAAEILKVSFKTLHLKVKEYGLE